MSKNELPFTILLKPPVSPNAGYPQIRRAYLQVLRDLTASIRNLNWPSKEGGTIFQFDWGNVVEIVEASNRIQDAFEADPTGVARELDEGVELPIPSVVEIK